MGPRLWQPLRRDQPPEDRAAGRAHEMRVWATDDVFTALTSEARERGWTLSRVIEALLIEVAKRGRASRSWRKSIKATLATHAGDVAKQNPSRFD